MNGILALVRDRKSWEVVVKDIWVGLKGTRGVQGPVWYCATLLVFVTFAEGRSGSQSDEFLRGIEALYIDS